LAKMAMTGLIKAGISLDPWHEPINPIIIKAFTKEKFDRTDKRFIRRVHLVDSSRGPQKAGRCTWGVEKCPMYGCPFVDVSGLIHECGCPDAPVIGSVFAPERFAKEYGEHKWGCALGLPDPDWRLPADAEEKKVAV